MEKEAQKHALKIQRKVERARKLLLEAEELMPIIPIAATTKIFGQTRTTAEMIAYQIKTWQFNYIKWQMQNENPKEDKHIKQRIKELSSLFSEPKELE